MEIRLYIPGIPVAQPRARATVRHTRFGPRASVYNPKGHPVETFKATTRLVARKAFTGPPLTGPLRVELTLVFPRPKGMVWKRKPMPREWHVVKPDVDNTFKAFTDCLNQLLWVDDSQICSTSIDKAIAAGDESPHVEARIIQLGDYASEG